MTLNGRGILVLVALLATGAARAELAGKEADFWQSTIKPYMDMVLKDPFSANYRGLEVQYHVDHPDQPTSVCGWVNAKNGYGGYTGWTNFLAHEDSVYFGNSESEFDRKFVQYVCNE